MKTLKKILEIVVDVIVVAILLISVAVIIMNANKKDPSDPPEIFGNVIYIVGSDSMTPTFNDGDIIVCKKLTDDVELKAKEDVVTFTTTMKQLEDGSLVSLRDTREGKMVTVTDTHRINRIDDTTYSYPLYYTKGDKEGLPEDTDPISRGEIIAVYSFRLAGLGDVVTFLKKPVGFVCCLVIPMVIIIGFEVYKLIVMFMKQKKEEMVAEVQNSTSDEVKDAIIKEYLAKQAAEQAAKDAKDNDESKS